MILLTRGGTDDRLKITSYDAESERNGALRQ